MLSRRLFLNSGCYDMATNKLAIDFDSVYTNIYMLGGGLVLSEPTVAAVSRDEKCEVKAIGDEARRLIGKTAKTGERKTLLCSGICFHLWHNRKNV